MVSFHPCWAAVIVATTSLKEISSNPSIDHHPRRLRRRTHLQSSSNERRTPTMRTGEQGRIVGGVSIPTNGTFDLSFLVSVLRQVDASDQEGAGGFITICSGSLIESNVVLTSAMCAGEATHVRVGMSNMTEYIASSFDHLKQMPDPEIFAVVESTAHPYYNQVTRENDVALMKLSGGATIGRPIPLNFDASAPAVDDDLTVLGWGATEEGGSLSSEPLQATVHAIDNSLCAEIMHNTTITPNMLCAYAPGRDACNGDSGGPLVQESGGNDDNTVSIVGVVSMGYGCARVGYPGVYARVSSTYKWIDHMRKHLSP